MFSWAKNKLKLFLKILLHQKNLGSTFYGGKNSFLGAENFNLSTKGCSTLFNHFIDMRTTVNLSISCRKNVFFVRKFQLMTTLLTQNGHV